ncbi:flavin reductase family protein [Terrarubrum flagellatum]|uniref:flavin reductase family protein n=1 Tax=Terrirubrum flagellatum TaxID=2895980 RepID=UPI0031456B8D
MFYEPKARDRSLLPHDPFKAIIAPRPIGWVTTIARDGSVNLAPYSFFNAFSGNPPIIGFSSEGVKDSASFAEETREFTFNLATFDLRDKMNQTSAPLPRGTSEFAHASLTPAPARIVKPPRVAESPASLECVVTEIVALKDRYGVAAGALLVIGEVVGVHIDDRFVKDGRFDTAGAQPIARCGYQDYAVVNELFSIVRPPGAGQ